MQVLCALLRVIYSLAKRHIQELVLVNKDSTECTSVGTDKRNKNNEEGRSRGVNPGYSCYQARTLIHSTTTFVRYKALVITWIRHIV